MNIEVFRGPLVWAVLLALGGCAALSGPPAAEVPVAAGTGAPEEGGVDSLLSYYQLVNRMSPQELARERSALTTQAATPAHQLRLAMVLGMGRSPADLNRAASLLDGILRSQVGAAPRLHALARLLADHYGERIRLEQQAERATQQAEKAAQQARDSQRRAAELQEKIDALADIEHSLPLRSRGARPAAGGGR
ncbi:MAG: permease [Azonexus sp.]|jgi:hypothetical protein|nr:permease [Betaproteobacteria bacterium]MBK8918243.1 permease [Betaproteobacteria bacterium]MBP6036207.1 permease [Azonexus sp.]MBP6906730.1 permease [Azonexus sp.]